MGWISWNSVDARTEKQRGCDQFSETCFKRPLILDGDNEHAFCVSSYVADFSCRNCVLVLPSVRLWSVNECEGPIQKDRGSQRLTWIGHGDYGDYGVIGVSCVLLCLNPALQCWRTMYLCICVSFCLTSADSCGRKARKWWAPWAVIGDSCCLLISSCSWVRREACALALCFCISIEIGEKPKFRGEWMTALFLVLLR
jgi:hypothetical protein